MARALSLRDCYDREEALHDVDPMVRIAAVHRAGAALSGNPLLRQRLLDRLRDADERVARYAAVTLAQAGDPEGLRFILRELAGTEGEQRRQLEGCLRCCTRFPFAVLLKRLVALESLNTVRGSKHWLRLEELLFLSAEEFWQQYCADSETPGRLVQAMNELHGTRGLVRHPQVACVLGILNSLPQGEQPGYVRLVEPNQQLPYTSEALLNTEGAWPGQDTLVVGRTRATMGRSGPHRGRDRPRRKGGRLREQWLEWAADEDGSRHVVCEAELLYALAPP